MAHVRAGYDAVESRSDLIVLLGVAPEAPDPEYGWIEPGVATLARLGVEPGWPHMPATATA